jgi:two-component system, OmpR family, phosphate regulon response regulator PhoB
VDVHIGHLRRALKGDSEKDLIRTVRSAGYALIEGREDGELPPSGGLGTVAATSVAHNR